MTDELIDDLIELTVAANQILRGPDFRIQFFQSSFRENATACAARTLQLFQSLTSFTLGSPVSDNDLDFSLEAGRAIRSLLDSPDLDILDRPRRNPTPIAPVEHFLQGEIDFLFCRTVPKPARFVHSCQLPEAIPTITRLPSIVNPTPGKLSISSITYISGPELLASCCDLLRTAYSTGPIYVSLHIHRVRTYRPIPCLLLLMSPDYSVYAVDILECRDVLGSVYELLQDPGAVHVMFAPLEILKILAESLGMYVSNVLDVSGNDGLSLEKTLASEHLNKCVVDWRIRPLNEELLLIAARSVWFLPRLADKVLKTQPSTELFERARQFADPFPYDHTFSEEDVENTVREIALSVDSLGEFGLEILTDLVRWRDSIGALEDESPNFIALDAALLRIAQMKPTTAEEIDECLTGCSNPILDSYRSDLVILVKKYMVTSRISHEIFVKELE
jgi:ribonuclease D